MSSAAKAPRQNRRIRVVAVRREAPDLLKLATAIEAMAFRELGLDITTLGLPSTADLSPIPSPKLGKPRHKAA